jgi:hypothetical protein
LLLLSPLAGFGSEGSGGYGDGFSSSARRVPGDAPAQHRMAVRASRRPASSWKLGDLLVADGRLQ